MSNAGSNLGDKVRGAFETVYGFGESIRASALDFADAATGTSGRHENVHKGSPKAGDHFVRTREYDRPSGPPPRPADTDTLATDTESTAYSEETRRDSAEETRRDSVDEPHAGATSREEKAPIVEGSADAARRAAKSQMEASEKIQKDAGRRQKVNYHPESQPVASAFGYYDPETSTLTPTPPKEKQ